MDTVFSGLTPDQVASAESSLSSAFGSRIINISSAPEGDPNNFTTETMTVTDDGSVSGFDLASNVTGAIGNAPSWIQTGSVASGTGGDKQAGNKGTPGFDVCGFLQKLLGFNICHPNLSWLWWVLGGIILVIFAFGFTESFGRGLGEGVASR